MDGGSVAQIAEHKQFCGEQRTAALRQQLYMPPAAAATIY